MHVSGINTSRDNSGILFVFLCQGLAPGLGLPHTAPNFDMAHLISRWLLQKKQAIIKIHLIFLILPTGVILQPQILKRKSSSPHPIQYS